MFPKEFYWGAATASYQIEGGWDQDGKGPSIWDAFSHTPGKVKDNDTGDIACDHLNRFREDVALMKKLGLKAYRFSFSWPRLIPEGTGEVNEKGVAFYSELIDELLEAGITPFGTLYHWDLPLALQEKGGWCNPDSADWFYAYAHLIGQRFGDRVKRFFTFNEPSVFLKGLTTGVHAPGLQMTPHYYVKAHHNVLRAHGRAVTALRETVPGVKIGVAPAVTAFVPGTDKPEDIEACREMFFATKRIIDGKPNSIMTFFNTPSTFLDPIVFGTYPQDCLEVIGSYLPKNWQQDMASISQPIDFIAHNTYQGVPAVSDGKGGLLRLSRPAGYPRTAIDWPITPECMYWVPKFLYDRYHLPMYTSENGLSCHDVISLDGKVHDPNRIDYLNRHLLMLEKAIESGVDMQGYFHWSLLDNFEWARGYFDRFGLIFVDYPTQKRIIKDSGHWYSGVIASNGEQLHCYE